MTRWNWQNKFARLSPVVAAAVAAMLALGTAWSSTARANEADVVAGFVRELSEQAIAVISADELSDAERTGELRRLLTSSFEVDPIGRFVLGRHWRHATEAERAEYSQLFEDFIVATYASRLARFASETMTVEGARLERENSAVVDSIVARGGSERIALNWHLRRINGDWRVVDLVIEGISMAVTQRSEFASVIRGNGGRIDGLLSAMRQRTARL